MSALWGVCLLVVLGAIWLVGREDRAALRDWYHATPPQTVYEVVLLTAVGFWAALRSVMLLITLGQQSALPVAAHWAVAAMALLTALYRFRR
jgi:hypothetical protein